MTMEDMWKDISLASLYDHNSPAGGGSAATSAANNRSAAFRGFIFQDFLAAGTTNLTPSSLASDPLPAPPVLLSLSSGSDHFQQHQIQSTATTIPSAAPPVSLKAKKTQRMHNSATGISSVISFSNSPEVLNSSDPYCKKRTAEENGESSRHVRHKRMIKNRESASRSRARKQAYTNDLEIEIDQRREENARLKRQLEQLYAAAPAANFLELPKRAHSV